MTKFKMVLASTAIVLSFGIGSAMAASTGAAGNNGGGTNGATNGATNGDVSGQTNAPQNNGAAIGQNGGASGAIGDMTVKPSATVVAKCAAAADSQGLVGDARGAFTHQCEMK